MRKIDSIMIHHSLTKDSETVSWAAIERYHIETNGWTDIGYHYGIEQINGIYHCLVGRPEHRPAAACPQGNMNHRAIHICCVGNFDVDKVELLMLKLLVKRLLLPIMDRYGIIPSRIYGHRDFNPAKTCPGKGFDMMYLREITQK